MTNIHFTLSTTHMKCKSSITGTGQPCGAMLTVRRLPDTTILAEWSKN